MPMKLIIHAHHLSLPTDLTDFLAKHVTKPLSRVYDDPAAELAVHLGDARPKRGGVDQECRLTFRMPGTRQLSVGSTKDDLYTALLDATKRLRTVMKKELGKMRSPTRKTTHRPLGRTYRTRSTNRGVTPAGDPATL
jgi:putative sigma-54 modulation protein